VDHYRVLQVTRDADPVVIERAYKALSMKYHPDQASPAQRDTATRRMQRLNEAYRVLHDPNLRRDYDAQLPAETAADAWDEFLEIGLLGMFWNRARRSARS
jgi:DnaJ-class molecular chaperone